MATNTMIAVGAVAYWLAMIVIGILIGLKDNKQDLSCKNDKS